MDLKELLGDIQTERCNAHECPSQDCDERIACRKNRDGSIPLAHQEFRDKAGVKSRRLNNCSESM